MKSSRKKKSKAAVPETKEYSNPSVEVSSGLMPELSSAGDPHVEMCTFSMGEFLKRNSEKITLNG